MFTGTLVPFQQDAFDMMVEEKKVLLAATMGSGKTVCLIAVTESLIEQGEAERVLIIVPSSLKYQWEHRYEEFTDVSRLVVIDGPRPKREKLYESFDRVGEYLVVSYKTAVSDWDILSGFEFDVAAIDEAQAIKSPGSQRSQVTKDLMLRAPYRYGLTGTPVENKAEEAFSIMEGIDPDLFGEPRLFDRTFIVRDHWGNVSRYVNLPLFRKTLKKKMYRVSKKDIADQLPQTVPANEFVEFDEASKKLWKTVVRETLLDLEELVSAGMTRFDVDTHYRGDSDYNLGLKGRVMSKVTCLRMLGDHPQLLRESASNYVDEEIQAGSEYASTLEGRGLLDKLPKTSPKYRRALEILLDLAADESKVVLFSFFKPILRWLEEDLTNKGVGAVRFDGSMNAKEKDRAQQAFLNDDDVSVFLASDAGGSGLDLPVASHLINYNLPWSAGQLEQRNARITRISSTHERVYVLNLMTENSIDVRQYESLQKKSEASEALIDGVYDEATGSVNVSMESLKQYLEATLEAL